MKLSALSANWTERQQPKMFFFSVEPISLYEEKKK